jgi:hypothetical protein
MEDLRPKQTKPEVNVPEVAGLNLPRFVISKKLKTIIGRLILIGFVALVLRYPFEIGDTIGKWVHDFYTGITHRF